jgi:hypothetical protein
MGRFTLPRRGGFLRRRLVSLDPGASCVAPPIPRLTLLRRLKQGVFASRFRNGSLYVTAEVTPPTYLPTYGEVWSFLRGTTHPSPKLP